MNKWRNETGAMALLRVLHERPPMSPEMRAYFEEGFIAGWQERGIAEPGQVTITRQYLAQLEETAALWRAAGGR